MDEQNLKLAFLDDLDKDLRQSVLQQLKVLWTHTSTAIEGNSLSLGETHFVLEEGLAVSGKPIKDHEEVIGHGRAIDLVYSMLNRPVTADDFFLLHQAVQTERVTDIYKPQDAWKNEPNGTSAVDDGGNQVFIEYAMPVQVPDLMRAIIEEMNAHFDGGVDADNAHIVYAKVHIGIASVHPFWDGNGRIARLAANIPLLNSGLPPIVIQSIQRQEYLGALADYQIAAGSVTAATGPWVEGVSYERFECFCADSYASTKHILHSAFAQQQRRIP